MFSGGGKMKSKKIKYLYRKDTNIINQLKVVHLILQSIIKAQHTVVLLPCDNKNDIHTKSHSNPHSDFQPTYSIVKNFI